LLAEIAKQRTQMQDYYRLRASARDPPTDSADYLLNTA
jgi:hypothetical protein